MIYISRPVSDECSVEHQFVSKGREVVVGYTVRSVEVSETVFLARNDLLSAILKDARNCGNVLISIKAVS